jgi:hypothetical protein
MRIFKHRRTNKVYGRTSDGRVYHFNDRAEWTPNIHTPSTDMFELRRDEFPLLFQSFERKVLVV